MTMLVRLGTCQELKYYKYSSTGKKYLSTSTQVLKFAGT